MEENLQREISIKRSRSLLERFTPSEPDWLDELHPQLSVEFPFGAGVGLPARIDGKEACAGLLQLVSDKLNLKFSDFDFFGMADPNVVLAQYEGKGHFNGKIYEQKYITLLRYEDNKLILFREHFDTQIIADVIGNLSAL